MKSLRLFSGAVFTGAITLSHAAVALAVTATTPAATTASHMATSSTSASSAASAAGENTPINLGGTSTTSHAASTGGASIVRTIIGLLIVVAVIYGLSIILRRAKRGSRGGKTKGSALRPVASLPLGSGRSVQLVRAGSDFLLLGVAEHGVTRLGRYTEAEALAAGLELPADDSPRTYPEDDPGSTGRVLDVLRRMTVRS